MESDYKEVYSSGEQVEKKVEQSVGMRGQWVKVKLGREWMWFGVWFGGMAVLKLLGRGIWGLVSVGSVLFVVGGCFGMLVSWIDRLVYVYFVRPEEELSVVVKERVAAKRYRVAMELLARRRHEQVHLAMENVLFLGVWGVLALFIVTSTPSWLAKGMVLGMGLKLIYGMYEDWKDQDYLLGRLFWPVRRKVGLVELKAVVAVFGGCFLLVSGLGI